MLRSFTFGMLSTPPPYWSYRCRTMASDSYTVSPVFGSGCTGAEKQCKRTNLVPSHMKTALTLTSFASS